MFTYFWVAAGGAIGTVVRCWLSGVIAQRAGEVFPLGTLAVNVTGCFIAGLFVAMTGVDGRVLVSPTFRQFFLIGVCGGYTTFSSFGVQTLTLIQEGQWLHAAANVTGSVVLCLVAVWLGYIAGGALNRV